MLERNVNSSGRLEKSVPKGGTLQLRVPRPVLQGARVCDQTPQRQQTDVPSGFRAEHTL